MTSWHSFRRRDKVFNLRVSYEDETVELESVRPATKSEQGLTEEKAKPRRKRGPYVEERMGCGKAPIYRWLGIRWFGYPWPLRWRYSPASGGVIYLPMLGCGCMVRPKKVAVALREAWLILLRG